MKSLSIQVMSDLHLEIYGLYGLYGEFTFPKTAPYLALLGDIGHVGNDQFFSFLETQLEQYSMVFFLLGDHEPCQMSFRVAKKIMRNFEKRVNSQPKWFGRFVFLDQTRHDITNDFTILGCTLFSRISPGQEAAIRNNIGSFTDILEWTTDDHNAAHRSDVAWLNDQVTRHERHEPHRKVIIFTHYSPSTDPRTVAPSQRHSGVSTAFSTDLSGEPCWGSPVVAAWVFGHTHFNCDLKMGSMRVLTNQCGSEPVPVQGFDPGRTLVVPK